MVNNILNLVIEIVCCIRSMTVFEWCATIYCCMKTKDLCRYAFNEISTNVERIKGVIVPCFSCVFACYRYDDQIADDQIANDHELVGNVNLEDIV